MKAKKILLSGVLSTVLIGCGTTPMKVVNPVNIDNIPETSDVDKKYYIQVGDTIRINVDDVASNPVPYGMAALPGSSGSNTSMFELPVRPDGKILLPLLRDPIDVAGYTTKEVQTKLEKEYKKFVKSPNVLVNIIEFSPRQVFVMGEIAARAAAEPIPYSKRLTALRVVAIAGYDVKRANLENIIVVRSQGAEEKPLVITLDITKAIRNLDLRHDIKLMPNDVVIVPKTSIVSANDYIEQHINNMVPLPGLFYGIGAAIAIDAAVN